MVALRMSWFARSFDRPSEIPLEMLEAEPLWVDKTEIESPLDQDFQFTQAKHCDSRLPATPDNAFGLRLQLHEGVAEKSRDQGPIEFPLQHQHRRCFAHAGSNELLGLGVENDLIERLRIAIE